jgi:hypothetical protein
MLMKKTDMVMMMMKMKMFMASCSFAAISLHSLLTEAE